MASIYKKFFYVVRRGVKVKQHARKWSIKYKDETGEWKTTTGYTDKELTKRKAAMVEHDVECRRRGLVDPFEAPKLVGLAEHLKAFREHLHGKDNSPDYIEVTLMRIQSVFDACGFTKIESLTAFDATGRVTNYLAERRQAKTDPLSHTTSNYYLAAVKGFARWGIDNNRLPPCQLANLKRLSTETDDDRTRRTLSAAQFRALIKATMPGKKSHGLTGAQRAQVYYLATQTGLRAGELSKLKPSDFHLDGDTAYINVRATISKNRQATQQPLRPDSALFVRQWLTGLPPDSPVWKGWNYRRAAEMLRRDLKAAAIPYTTAEGVFDFHALRATFVTNLVRAGVNPKIVQKLARHSTITLTMDLYAKLEAGEAGKALNKLPKWA